MKLKRRFLLFIIYPAFLSCLLPAAIYIYKHPAYNFDMLGYMALVVRMDKPRSIEEIHNITYSSARQNLPPEEYKKLTDAPPYRKKFETVPSEFEKILPNYIVKPLYTRLCWLFYKSGFSLPMATAMPSLISYLVLGLFLFHWLNKYLLVGITFLGAALVMYSTIVTAIAQLSTPDCLSALFLVLAFYFILERRNITLMFIFFLLSIFTRVDNIITCFIMISFLTFSKKWKSINVNQYIFMLMTLVVAYLFIILPVRQFGWSIFYYSQYSRHIDYSRDFDQSVSFLSHLSLVYSKLTTAFISTHFTFFAFLGLLVFLNKKFSFKNLSFDQAFLLVLIFIGLFKFILLPDLSDRFYFGFYLIIIILLVKKNFLTNFNEGK